MEILPQDLGPRRQVALILMRGMGKQGPAASFAARRPAGAGPLSGKRLGAWGRFFTRGLGLQPDAAAALTANLGGVIGGSIGGFGGGFLGPGIPLMAVGVSTGVDVMAVTGAALCALGVAGAGFGFAFPNGVLRRWNGRPVSAAEMGALAELAGEDELERTYLAAVGEAASLTGLSGEQAEGVRDALRALGAGIDRLPREATPLADAVAWRENLAELQAAAESEPDPVIAESLRRRCEAVEGSLRALSNAERLTRRTKALHDEMLTQVETLRIGLSALRSGATADAPHTFATLAASLRGVSAEADAVSAARAELAAALGEMPEAAPPPRQCPAAGGATEGREVAVVRRHQ